MFGFTRSNICLAVLVFLLVGCSFWGGNGGGIPLDKKIILDDEYEHTVSIRKGGLLGVDVRQPSAAGYRIVGAFFDPTILDLTTYVQLEDQTPHRVLYAFKALESGFATVLIKMEPVTGGGVEIYKTVTVVVSED